MLLFRETWQNPAEEDVEEEKNSPIFHEKYMISWQLGSIQKSPFMIPLSVMRFRFWGRSSEKEAL